MIPMAILNLLPIAMAVAFVSLLLAFIAGLAFQRARACSLPRPSSPSLVRWGETALWTLAAGLLLLNQFWRYENYFYSQGTYPELLAELRKWFAVGGLVALAIAVAAALRKNRVACLLVVLAGIGAMTLGSTPAYEWPQVVAAVEKTSMPFTIDTPAELPPVTVNVNGVDFGQTPIVTTWEDLKTDTPDLEVQSEMQQQTGDGTLHWCPLSVHSTYRKPGAEPTARDEKAFFVRYHLDGQPLYAYDRNSFQWTGFLKNNFTGGTGDVQFGSRVFGRMSPFEVRHRVTRLDWAEDIQFLLHRARLMDYAVDDNWCEAFLSYGHLAECALVGLSESDPGLQDVLKALAIREYQLGQSPSSDNEGWRRIDEILDQAGPAGEFWMGGIAGTAVKHLAASISSEALAQRTVEFLAGRWEHPENGLETHRNRSGRVILFRGRPRVGLKSGHWLRLPVLEELAVERDARLDEESPWTDNPIEASVTPALMRWHRPGDGAEKQICGSAYERVLFRHDWRAAPDSAKWEDTEYVSGMQINRWLYRLVTLESRFGRNFRLSHQDLFQHLARDLWTSPMASFRLPSELHFLFLDHRADLPPADPDADGKRLTPAESFWRQFTERRPSFNDNREMVKTQWEYLARMAPDSRPEQFVDVLRKNPPDWLDGSAGEMFALMPADSALETVTALLAEFERQSQEPVRPAPSRDLRSDRAILLRGILTVDHPGLADLLVSELDRMDTGFQRGDVLAALREGRMALSVMQRLAESERPEIRLLVAESGLYRTDAASRNLLDTLSTDADENVRKAAQATLDEWLQWQQRALPRREEAKHSP